MDTANEDVILAAVEKVPRRNSRSVTRELERSQQRTLEVLRHDKAHPCHYSRSAYLFPGNPFLRMKFYEVIH